MKRSFLFVSLLWTLSLAAQIDSFSIGKSVFKFQIPPDWNIVFLKDTATVQGGPSNAVFRHPSFDDCTYSMIGIEVINTSVKPKTKEKKYRKKKNEESFAEFRTIGSYECFYYSTEAPKCKHTRYTSAYLHRINDTLDLVLYLNAAVEETESFKMEERFRTVVDSFFYWNDATIWALKPWTELKGVPDTTQILGRKLNFIVPEGWKVNKRYEEDKEDPTGKRVVMIPEKRKDDAPDPALSISVDDYDKKTSALNQFLFDFQTYELKKHPNAMSYQRIDSISTNVSTQGYDTLTRQRINGGTWNGDPVTFFVQEYVYIVTIEEKNYEIVFALTVPVSDALEMQYTSEMFRALCEEVRTSNHFKQW